MTGELLGDGIGIGGSNTSSNTGGGGIIPTPVIVPAPSGSNYSIYTPVISSNLLDLLSTSSKSKILSSTNLGISTGRVITSALELIENIQILTVYLLDETLLNSLASSAQTQTIEIANVGSSRFVRITINISEPITPSGASPNISILNGLNGYRVNLDLTSSSKKIIFDNIPSSFCSSFVVINNSGVSLPSFGNSILVQGL